MTKQEIESILAMRAHEFDATKRREARELCRSAHGNTITVTALLGYSNVCRNRCAYCGMRVNNTALRRYRLGIGEITALANTAVSQGVTRLFLISGEDPKYRFDDMLAAIEYGKKAGLFLSMAAGQYSLEQYRALAAAGLDEYVLKFETSDRALFNRIKPSTDFDARMRCIDHIKSTSMKLASGNIIGLPGQSLESIADDILLMKKLNISWAPVIPYMPVPGTPLAEGSARGSLEITLKEIALLRIMMPRVNITAQQPGEDISRGLGDVQGNLNALNSGANMLFIDMLPAPLASDFNVINNRMIEGAEKIQSIAKLAGMGHSMANTPPAPVAQTADGNPRDTCRALRE